MGELNTKELRRASFAVYLATDEKVADDLSAKLKYAANTIDTLTAELAAAKNHIEGLIKQSDNLQDTIGAMSKVQDGLIEAKERVEKERDALQWEIKHWHNLFDQAEDWFESAEMLRGKK